MKWNQWFISTLIFALLANALLVTTGSRQLFADDYSKYCLQVGQRIVPYYTSYDDQKSHNPAGQFCEVGKGDILDGAIDVSTLLKNSEPGAPKPEAIRTYLNHPEVSLPDHDGSNLILDSTNAEIYCQGVGGVFSYILDEEADAGVCKFQDGSKIEAETLLEGPHPGALVDILRRPPALKSASDGKTISSGAPVNVQSLTAPAAR